MNFQSVENFKDCGMFKTWNVLSYYWYEILGDEQERKGYVYQCCDFVSG